MESRSKLGWLMTEKKREVSRERAEDRCAARRIER